MLDKLNSVEANYEELMALLATPAVQSDSNEYRKHAKALAEIEPLVETLPRIQGRPQGDRDRQRAGQRRRRRHARAGQGRARGPRARRDTLLADMKLLLVPKDPNDQKNVVLEIRAGTGGEEAALFAYELFRMYSKFAEKQGWRVEVMSTNDSDVGGIKEVIAMIEGNGAYSKLKYESGVHRVQRVPATEASGRIHTSTVTVAVLPEAEEVDVQIDAERSSHRHVLLERPRRPERQHDVLSRAHHAYPHQHRGLPAGREIAGEEQRESDEGAARRVSTKWKCASSRKPSPKIAAARWAPANDRRKSAPTTSATTASPTIG